MVYKSLHWRVDISFTCIFGGNLVHASFAGQMLHITKQKARLRKVHPDKVPKI